MDKIKDLILTKIRKLKVKRDRKQRELSKIEDEILDLEQSLNKL